MQFTVSAVLIVIVALFDSFVKSVDIIDHNFRCSEISQDVIPETNLKTNTFYTLRLKRFPTGHITWTNQVHSSGSRFMQTDNGNSPHYQENGKWYYDAQWSFIPSNFHPGWYHLVNRRVSGEYASFNRDARVGQAHNKYHVLLNPNYSPLHPSGEDDYFLWKPVSHEGGKYYQIKSKAFPNAPVTWTEKKYLQNGHYVQVDSSGDVKYLYGGEWFDDTLFSFEPEVGGVRLHISIFKIQVKDNFTGDCQPDCDEVSVNVGGNIIFENIWKDATSQFYTAKGQVPERFQLLNSMTLPSTYSTVGIEDTLVVDTQGGIPFLATSVFKKKLAELYSLQLSSSSSLINETHFDSVTNRTISVTQRIDIPFCTRYEVYSDVNLIRGYLVDYVVQFIIKGEYSDNAKIPVAMLMSNYMPSDMEYVRTVDEYTIVAQRKDIMKVDFGTNIVINTIATPLYECLEIIPVEMSIN